MTTAACMRRPLEDRFLEHGGDDHDEERGISTQGRAIAAIDHAMTSAEHATSWPRFITVLRACGAELRERLLELFEPEAQLQVQLQAQAPPLRLRRSLLARLGDAGLSDELREQVAHANRTLERARGLWQQLRHTDTSLDPRAHEHEVEGDKAEWMHVFATILLCRVASGQASVTQPSTDFAVTLAVDSAREAYAHWATALELGSQSDAA